jgi:hypothetical protein
MFRTKVRQRAAGLATALVMLLVAGAVSAISFRSHPSRALLPDRSNTAELAVDHNPPRLVLPGEPVRLEFNVICPSPDAGRTTCSPVGSLALRSQAGATLPNVPLAFDEIGEVLAATLPANLIGAGVRYSATVVDPLSGRRVRFPADGSFDDLFVLQAPRDIDLGPYRFGSPLVPTEEVVVAAWGNQDGQLGLDTGPEQATIGPAAFAIDGDTLAILDQVNRRVMIDAVEEPPRYIDIGSAKVDDIVFDASGNLVLLDRDVPAGAALRTIRIDGTPLANTVVPGDTFEMLRATDAGLFVHGYPGARWSSPTASPTTSGLPLVPGRTLIVRGSSSETRLAVTDGSHLVASWRILGSPSFGDIQLAEADEDSATVVVRRYTDTAAEYQLIHADASGNVTTRSIASNDWADSNALGRFELRDGHLFQLVSSPTGAGVVRFDLQEVLG